MDKLPPIAFIVATLACLRTPIGAAASSCPANICSCRTLEIASRLETQVNCNTGDNRGYVPVLKSFQQPISSLYLSRIELTILGNLTFQRLSTVRELYLNDNFLVRIEARAFERIDYSIELLDLQHNRLRDLGFLTTHNFPRLRELLLRDNQLVTISLGSFSLLPALEVLNLDDNKLSGALSFLRQPSLRALADLNLDANRFREINPEDFLHLTNLKSLLVNRNQLNSVDFLFHPIFKQLHGFSAAHNQLGNINQSIFSDKNLMKWIDLSDNGLTNAEFLSFCSLERLEEIYLSHNQIRSLPSLSFQATKTLSIFAVDNNLLQTLPRCALLKFYNRMQTFDISNNPIQCNCNLSWLQNVRDITTDKQSQCANLEFTATDTYDTKGCTDLPKCVELNQCGTSSFPEDSLYGSETGLSLKEYYIQTTESVSTALRHTPKLLLVYFMLLIGQLPIV